MARHRKARTKPKTWDRSIPDSILLCHSTRSALDRAESLSPSLGTITRFCAGVPEAQAIIDSYAFRYPVSHRAVEVSA